MPYMKPVLTVDLPPRRANQIVTALLHASSRADFLNAPLDDVALVVAPDEKDAGYDAMLFASFVGKWIRNAQLDFLGGIAMRKLMVEVFGFCKKDERDLQDVLPVAVVTFSKPLASDARDYFMPDGTDTKPLFDEIECQNDKDQIFRAAEILQRDALAAGLHAFAEDGRSLTKDEMSRENLLPAKDRIAYLCCQNLKIDLSAFAARDLVSHGDGAGDGETSMRDTSPAKLPSTF